MPSPAFIHHSADIFPRQTSPNDFNNKPGYYDETSTIIRYTVTAGVVILFLGFIFGSYWHVQRRIKKGKEPLWYHKWMVTRNSNRPMWPYAGAGAFHRSWYPNNRVAPSGEEYNLHTWAPPPPAYSNDVPPTYRQAPGTPKPESLHQVHVDDLDRPAEEESHSESSPDAPQQPSATPDTAQIPREPAPEYPAEGYR